MAKRKRLPKDFNYTDVRDLDITNPLGAEGLESGTPISTEYPKHIHKFAGLDEKGVMLPLEFIVVADAKEEAQAKRDGYGTIAQEHAEGKKAEAEWAKAHGKPAAVGKAAAPAKAK